MFLHEGIQHDATSLIQLVKQKVVSPHELIDCALQQLEKTNPQINAVIRLFADKARTQIDEVMANNADAPFAGVPLLLKDLLAAYAGEPMGSGRTHCAGRGSGRWRRFDSDSSITQWFGRT